jgi:Flp pilus assembly CpaF family ATPase
MVQTEMSADEALRTSLRLGDSALIVGEIRSHEVRTLWEAMRICALSNVVAGTIKSEPRKLTRLEQLDEIRRKNWEESAELHRQLCGIKDGVLPNPYRKLTPEEKERMEKSRIERERQSLENRLY